MSMTQCPATPDIKFRNIRNNNTLKVFIKFWELKLLNFSSQELEKVKKVTKIILKSSS